MYIINKLYFFNNLKFIKEIHIDGKHKLGKFCWQELSYHKWANEFKKQNNKLFF